VGAAYVPRKVAMTIGDGQIIDVRKRRFSSRARLIGIAGGACLLMAVGLMSVASPASAVEATVGLGTAEAYSVLAGSTVTNTGPSTLARDLGVSPGSAITGFPPGIVEPGAVTHAADAAAGQAQSDLTIAYNDAAGRTGGADVGAAIGVRTLLPGVYNASSALDLTGALTLDGNGDPDSVFIIQVGSALTTESGGSVVMTNGAQACNVFWQVGSSATLNPGSTFAGTIMALTSITVDTSRTVVGRALARNGAVTLDTNTFTTPACTTPVTTPSSTSSSPTSGSPTSTPPTGTTAGGAGGTTAGGATGTGGVIAATTNTAAIIPVAATSSKPTGLTTKIPGVLLASTGVFGLSRLIPIAALMILLGGTLAVMTGRRRRHRPLHR
jgi:hypothetical protein